MQKMQLSKFGDASGFGVSPGEPGKITRVSVDLTPHQVKILEALMKRSGMSKAAILRFGLGILADSCSDKDDGFLVGAWKGDKERRYPVL